MNRTMARVLSLKDYSSLINLQPAPVVRMSNTAPYDSIVRELTQYFTGRNDSYAHLPTAQQRSLIREVLTVRDASPDQRFPARIYELIDQMLAFERDHQKSLTPAIHLPVQFSALPHIRVWRGDITTLAVDAIVNAANSGLLGCFQPTHLCIDNVIHAAAGPRLRDDCETIMRAQHKPEPSGHAKITIGHNLPCKYVLHTVGPQLHHGAHVTKADDQQLASCYQSCLNLAEEIGTITSIAFCCISTGLFAFPADRACHIAIETVLAWFRQRGTSTRLSLVVFDVFSPEDEQLYLDKLHALSK